ncbi:GTP cyclohydrolase II RibA [Candidatus Gracilibacteria bacterium]|nr:GTP cyclohydrolase II RibA [Thermales bacterium]NJL96795.1 GTP cyclohydrolase II RibA [Candidatus Gracilibacteria bacterium]NJS41109.1 GTP cyclohydrolase II RibA [Candidatus Gracilibacteria bacterium]
MLTSTVLFVTTKSISSNLARIIEQNGLIFQTIFELNNVDFQTYFQVIIDTSYDNDNLLIAKEGIIPSNVNSFYYNLETLDASNTKLEADFVSKLFSENSVNFRNWEFFAETILPTEFGKFLLFGFKSRFGNQNILGLRTMKIPKIPTIRTHPICYTGDIFHSLKCDCREELDNALRLIQREGGILLYPEEEGRGIGILNKIKIYEFQNNGADTVEAQHLGNFPNDLRNYDYLKDVFDYFKLTNIRLITNNPLKTKACFESGVNVTKVIKLPSTINKYNKGYLETKMRKNGHNFQFEFGQE